MIALLPLTIMTYYLRVDGDFQSEVQIILLLLKEFLYWLFFQDTYSFRSQGWLSVKDCDKFGF